MAQKSVCKLSDSDLAARHYVRHVKQVLSLPDIYINVTKLLNNPNTTAAEITKAIRYDIGLSARVLQVVNSAFYGFQREISNLQHAVSLIGFAGIAKLVLATSVADVFTNIPAKTINMKSFWRHSVFCASIAKQIAQTNKIIQHEDLFIAALLHDIGKLVIYQQSPDLGREILELSENDRVVNLSVEYEVLGFTHTQIGSELLKSWNLPEMMQHTTRFHHHPIYNDKYSQAIAIVHLADAIANMIAPAEEIGAPLDEYSPLLTQQALAVTATTEETIKLAVDYSYDQGLQMLNQVYPSAA